MNNKQLLACINNTNLPKLLVLFGNAFVDDSLVCLHVLLTMKFHRIILGIFILVESMAQRHVLWHINTYNPHDINGISSTALTFSTNRAKSYMLDIQTASLRLL